MNEREPLLKVRNLTTSFQTRGGVFSAIRGIDFDLWENETLALVGESGCGKSITALSVMRLVPEPAGRITSGEIFFKGRNLLSLSEEAMREIRGNRIAMVFQEPMTSLNPVLPVGLQVMEVLKYHQPISQREAREKALEIMNRVRIPSASRRFNDYPHQFSGGMRQRVMIAMALACKPEILLADEPTTALDVTIQAQVLSLLAELKRDRGMSVIFITHNLSTVAQIADRVAIMYGGEIVEVAPVDRLFEEPTHPYTEALLFSVPRVDRRPQRLSFIPGQVPAIDRFPPGCRFGARCSLRMKLCEEKDPDLIPLPGDSEHLVRCWIKGKSC